MSNLLLEEPVEEYNPFKTYKPSHIECAKIQEFLFTKGFRLSAIQSVLAEEEHILRFIHSDLGEFVLFSSTCRWHQVGKELLPKYAEEIHPFKKAKMFCGEGYSYLRSQWCFYNSGE